MPSMAVPGGQLAYQQWGSGPRKVLALHGFAMDHTAFASLAKACPELSIWALDLPFHGGTVWAADRFAPEELAAALHHFWGQVGGGRVEALGHSLGARLWLCMLPHLELAMSELWLIAPDGFGTYRSGFTERVPLSMRRRAARLTHNTGRALRQVEKLYRWKLLDAFTYRYLTTHLSGPDAHRRLLHTWASLSACKMGPARAQSYLSSKPSLPVHIGLARADRLVPAALIARAVGGLPQVSLSELPGGHRSVLDHLCAWMGPAPA
ncbi:alpha/beta fold hydrolase [Phaeodactylibacter luteus]|uniref:AB hydrolase-1 domain-containing protein n=1 Tax=Phaeodactylibacter luteus TaxID=1564516 RepID=A0A5C6RJR7_9BACT|nr:alpha/beta fold hydrolase [Phaeodactylibacter luteus]TXB62457.1 hypothetical protein FRY97_13775 [Phaeodactylibacter luteus]